MYEKPLHCKCCRYWYGGVPRTKYASWCAMHDKPAVRALGTCIEQKSKKPEAGEQECD